MRCSRIAWCISMEISMKLVGHYLIDTGNLTGGCFFHLLTGREKLGCSPGDGVRLVLESDGTHIDDGEYLKWLPDNTVFLLLRAGEPWTVAHKHHPSSHPTPAPSSHSAHQPHPAASFSSSQFSVPFFLSIHYYQFTNNLILVYYYQFTFTIFKSPVPTIQMTAILIKYRFLYLVNGDGFNFIEFIHELLLNESFRIQFNYINIRFHIPLIVFK